MTKENQIKTSVLAGLVLSSLAGMDASAQANDPEQLNRFRLAYRPGFNISASFNEINMPAVGPAQSGVNHEYVDGFNRVDRSGNALGLTSFFGYQNQSQVQSDSVLMHGFTSDSVKDVGNDPAHGLELSYDRQLGTIGKFTWGLEGAFNWTDVDLSDSGTDNLRAITDRYNIPRDLSGNLITLPQAPYAGTFTGPSGNNPGNTVLGDLPQRTSAAISGATAYRSLDAGIYGFRIGPYLEYPFNEKFSASLSGGFAFAYVDSSFDYRESWFDQFTQRTHVRAGSDSKQDWLFGGYVGGTVSYMFTKQFSAFVGAQYQNLGRFSQTANGKEASLDLSKSIFVTVGVGYSF